MSELTQISVSISPETRDRLNRVSKARGMRKNHIVEQALSRLLDELERADEAAELSPVLLTSSQLRRLHALLEEPAASPNEALLDYIAKARDLGTPAVEEFLDDERHPSPRSATYKTARKGR